MRIDLFGSAAVSTERSGAGAVSGIPTSASTVPQDTATLSPGSLSVPSLAAQVLSQAEARYAKVDALNRAVSSGAYTLDPATIAHAIASSGI
jgi:flagellar biosynthesis anti-sigma factor FlgM